MPGTVGLRIGHTISIPEHRGHEMSPSSPTRPLSPPSILLGCPQILRKEFPPSVWHWESSHQASKEHLSCPSLSCPATAPWHWLFPGTAAPH